MIRIGIDVIGTFTDLVAVDEAAHAISRCLRPRTTLTAAITPRIAVLLHDGGASGDVIGFVGHGATVISNFDRGAPREKPPS